MILDAPLSESYRLEGQYHQIPCSAIGHPAFEIKWLFNGVPLMSVVLGENGALLLQSVTRSMAGQYSCNVSNAAGWTTSRAGSLVVNCKSHL